MGWMNRFRSSRGHDKVMIGYTSGMDLIYSITWLIAAVTWVDAASPVVLRGTTNGTNATSGYDYVDPLIGTLNGGML